MSAYLGSSPTNVVKTLFRSQEAVALYMGTRQLGSEFSPLDLFKDGKQGVWLDPNDLSTMFQDIAGTVPVTKDGDPVGLIRAKSGNGNHATQTVSAARPVYKTNPSRLSLDKVDDAIIINMPKRIVGSMTLATTTGTATYGVDIPAGNFTLGGQYFPSTNIVGLVINEGELSDADKTALTNMFVSKGAVESFVSNTSLLNAFRDWRFLTSFPLIDTSSATDFYAAWISNKLTSFPLLDFRSGTGFQYAWQNNTTLVNFPRNMFDNVAGSDFSYAFANTGLSQESIDGILVSLVASGITTGKRAFHQSGGSAPSSIGKSAIDTLRSRGWTVSVTGGY